MIHHNHRGPDNFGYYNDNFVTLGHLRLSILDLESRSNQPFFATEYAVVFNGEIYNFKYLKGILEKLDISLIHNLILKY